MSTKRFFDVIDTQLAIVMALEDPEVTEVAKKLAYYVAMVDAAEDDPLDNPKDQEDVLRILKVIVKILTEEYQKLVNERI